MGLVSLAKTTRLIDWFRHRSATFEGQVGHGLVSPGRGEAVAAQVINKAPQGLWNDAPGLCCEGHDSQLVGMAPWSLAGATGAASRQVKGVITGRCQGAAGLVP